MRSVIHTMLDDRLVEAVGLARPARPMRRRVPAALRLRDRLLRFLSLRP